MRAESLSVCLCLAVFGVSACGDEEEKKEDAGPARPSEPSDEEEEDLLAGLSQEDAAKVLAKVDGTTITLGEFVRRINEQSPFLRARYNSPERRREFLDNLIRFELLAREAERRGYADDPEVQRTLKQSMIQRLMKKEFEARVKVSDIPEEAMRKYYDSHIEDYHKPEQVRASHILVKNRAAAEGVLRDALAKAGNARAFREIARERSEDEATKARGGDLRYFSRPDERRRDEPDVPQQVAEAAFSISNVGEVHGELVESDRGFHVVKLTGKRKALKRSFEDVRRTIQNRLWREKRQGELDRFVQELRERSGVTVDEEALTAVRIEASEGPRGSHPGRGAEEGPGSSAEGHP